MTDNVEIQEGVTALELLDRILSTTAVDVPVLIALDTESSCQGRLSELGVSVFDPLCLHPQVANHPDLMNECIVTYYYAKGGSKDRVNYKPYRLGTPQPPLRNEDMEQILNAHFRPIKPDGNPREVILIGHNITCDLTFINECSGIEISNISNIAAILDTQKIARLVLGTIRSSLKHILQDMKLNFVGLHNAGHDSRYTLRALLMLFVLYKRQSSIKDQSEDFTLTRLLAEIARCHKTNERRKWSTPMKSKPASTLDIFSLDVEDGGIMNSLT